MIYDFSVNLEMIDASPNSFKTFVYGILAAFSAVVFRLYFYLLDCGTMIGFKFYLFRKYPANGTVIKIPDIPLFSTTFFMWNLIFSIIAFTVFLLYHSIIAYKKNEGTFLFTIGIFLNLFAIANTLYSVFDAVDISVYFLIGI